MVELTDRVMMLTGGTTASVEDLKEAMGVTDGGAGASVLGSTVLVRQSYGQPTRPQCVGIEDARGIAVFWYQCDGNRGAVQTPDEGFFDPGLPPDVANFQPVGINYSGRLAGNSNSDNQAYLWNGVGFVPLGFLAGGNQSTAYAMAGDYIVGAALDGASASRAFVSNNGGTLVNLDNLEDDNYSAAYAVADDGLMIAGIADVDGDPHLFRVTFDGTTGGGMEDLGNASAGTLSLDPRCCAAISNGGADAIITGRRHSSDGTRGYFWQHDVFTTLPAPTGYDPDDDGDNEYFAVDITADGLWILVAASQDGDSRRLFLWDMTLSAYTDLGLPTGMTDVSAGRISSPGGDINTLLVVSSAFDWEVNNHEDSVVRWTKATGWVSVGTIPGGVTNVTNDGRGPGNVRLSDPPGEAIAGTPNPINTLVFHGFSMAYRGAGVMDIHLAPSSGAAVFQLRESGNPRPEGSIDLQLDMGKNSDTEICSGFGAVICGGSNNTNAGFFGYLGGGQNNNLTVDTGFSVAVGGSGNLIQGNSGYSVIVGGQSNIIDTVSYGFIGSGSLNLIDNSCLFGSILNGTSCIVNADYSSASGQSANTKLVTAKDVFASNKFGITGDAQIGRQMLMAQTTDATPAVAVSMTDNNPTPSPTNQIALDALATQGMNLRILAKDAISGDASYWTFDGAFSMGNDPSTTAQVGSTAPVLVCQDAGAAAWAVTVTADVTNGAVAVTVTGEADKSIRWIVRVHTEELTIGE